MKYMYMWLFINCAIKCIFSVNKFYFINHFPCNRNKKARASEQDIIF